MTKTLKSFFDGNKLIILEGMTEDDYKYRISLFQMNNSSVLSSGGKGRGFAASLDGDAFIGINAMWSNYNFLFVTNDIELVGIYHAHRNTIKDLNDISKLEKILIENVVEILKKYPLEIAISSIVHMSYKSYERGRKDKLREIKQALELE